MAELLLGLSVITGKAVLFTNFRSLILQQYDVQLGAPVDTVTKYNI
jgi:hypothetical protein